MKPIACKTSPPKVAEKDHCHCQEGLFPIPCQQDYNDTALEAIQAHQQSRRTAGWAKSQARASPKHCTIQIPASTEPRSWTLQYSAKTLPFLLGKNSSPFLLTGRIPGFWKTLQPRPHFFPSPCVGIVTDVMIHHQLFLVFSYCVRDEAEACTDMVREGDLST